jgi:ParB family chromosome partitioning protein
MNIQSLPISDIYSLGNIRQNTTGMDELVESMRTNGQEIEIRVYPDGHGRYILKAGHRRLQAATQLGWDTIRAVIEIAPENEVELLVSQFTENDVRSPMRYLEKANIYARMKELGHNQRAIARQFGLSDADVSLALSLLKASPKIQKAVNDGIITPSAAEPLLSQPVDVQEELADAAIQARTVRKVAALVHASKSKKESMTMELDNEQPVPEDADPMESVALEGLNEALANLRMVEQTKIKHPELVRQARPTVEELLRIAASLKVYLDHENWDILDDLA